MWISKPPSEHFTSQSNLMALSCWCSNFSQSSSAKLFKPPNLSLMTFIHVMMSWCLNLWLVSLLPYLYHTKLTWLFWSSGVEGFTGLGGDQGPAGPEGPSGSTGGTGITGLPGEQMHIIQVPILCHFCVKEIQLRQYKAQKQCLMNTSNISCMFETRLIVDPGLVGDVGTDGEKGVVGSCGLVGPRGALGQPGNWLRLWS